jgi:transglutaminase-like putative cysteine protease
MLYRALHTTRYTYEGPVSHCLSETRLTPRILPHQSLHDWELMVVPRPANVLSRKDYFGNDVTSFSVLEAHDTFTVTASSLIELRPAERAEGIPTTVADARLRIPVSATEFVYESPLIPNVPEIAAYAADILSPSRPILEATTDLMRRIFKDFTYKPESTTIDTPLCEVFANRTGVCQDYAHAMIGALRSQEIPARYVSGYLRGDAELQGAQASHAWVQVLIPGAGWQDFDPTNNIRPSDSHLTIAWGRDYSDIPPVKGITVGGGAHTLDVEVHVLPSKLN